MVPAAAERWPDLQTVLGTRGAAYRCQCQRFRLAPGESFARHPPEVRAARLRDQVAEEPAPGLLAYLGPEPVGWCAVAPRCDLEGLVRSQRVPWAGRDEDREDPTVWALTCLFTRAGSRKRGVSRALAAAAVEHARSHGARALEAYPMTTTLAIDEELGVGIEDVLLDAGFREVGRPTKRRALVRVDF